MQELKDMKAGFDKIPEKFDSILDEVYWNIVRDISKLGIGGFDSKVKYTYEKFIGFNLITEKNSIDKIVESVQNTFSIEKFKTVVRNYKDKKVVGSLKDKEFYGTTIKIKSENKLLKLSTYYVEIQKL